VNVNKDYILMDTQQAEIDKWRDAADNMAKQYERLKVEADARIREVEEDRTHWKDGADNAEARIRELEAQVADLRDLAYNRAPKLAAEECNKQKAELEARLAVAKETAQHWDGKWEAVKPLCEQLGIDEPDARQPEGENNE